MMAREGMAFEKYTSFCELEERHNIEIGPSYRTAPSAKQFTHFIAQSQRNAFLQQLAAKKFYSFLMDSSTDSAYVEQEFSIYSKMISLRRLNQLQGILLSHLWKVLMLEG